MKGARWALTERVLIIHMNEPVRTIWTICASALHAELRKSLSSFFRNELLHRIELISEEPFLNDLTIAQAKDGDSCNSHLLTCGNKAKEGALVGATLHHADTTLSPSARNTRGL